ncbi:MAG: M1 family aminopeptidase [Gemmatimonadota bacterium]
MPHLRALPWRRLACALLALMPSAGHAQSFEAAATYEAYYDQLMHIQPLTDQGASVAGITLKRDAGQLEFIDGRIWLLTPVNGRTIGVAFRGHGNFRFSPPSPMEQERLRERKHVTAMDEPFTEAVIFFGDSTLEELKRRVTFGPGEDGNGLRGRIRGAFEFLGKDNNRSLDPDLLLTLLNGERNDLFYAHLANRGDPWFFMIDPAELEGVRLMVPPGRGFNGYSEVVTQFPRQGVAPTSLERERYPEARIRDYKIEVWLTQDMAADLRFRAAARVEITSDTAEGPWTSFAIFDDIDVDSARWENGEPAEVFKPDDFYTIMVRMPHRLAPGERLPLKLYYHGNVIDRFGEWFFVKSSIAWYPVGLEGRNRAFFDLTFHYPRSLTLASIGERTDSTLVGTVRTTRWVTQDSIRNASFNIGLFDEIQLTGPGQIPVTMLWSDKGHREAFQGVLTQKNPSDVVSSDVVAALKFYQSVFGVSPVQHFYATEIPYGHGEAFPGMINLSYVTFVQTSEDGFDEVFRAHEVGHQWWGIGVDYSTYHDRWLSEGFSSFAGLWFMQTRRGDNKRYFGLLDHWQADIMLHRDEPVPIWLGHRVAREGHAENYNDIVYQKGAWVLHMLRMLTLDLQTMKEDRFTNIMRDFYRTYHSSRASTEDFRRVVERNVGTDMGWFFNQWVYNSAIPTYRVAWRSEPQPDGQFKVRLRVQQEKVPEDFIMYVPVTIDLGGNRVARVRVKITGAVSEVLLPVTLPSQPRSVKFNDMQGVLAEVKTTSW